MARYDLDIVQGQTFHREILWKNPDGTPVNMTGFTARLQIREDYASPRPIITLTSSPVAGLTITALLGKIVLDITAAQSSVFQIRRGVYDLEIDQGGGTFKRLLEGRVDISPEVTR